MGKTYKFLNKSFVFPEGTMEKSKKKLSKSELDKIKFQANLMRSSINKHKGT